MILITFRQALVINSDQILILEINEKWKTVLTKKINWIQVKFHLWLLNQYPIEPCALQKRSKIAAKLDRTMYCCRWKTNLRPFCENKNLIEIILLTSRRIICTGMNNINLKKKRFPLLIETIHSFIHSFITHLCLLLLASLVLLVLLASLVLLSLLVSLEKLLR